MSSFTITDLIQYVAKHKSVMIFAPQLMSSTLQLHVYFKPSDFCATFFWRLVLIVWSNNLENDSTGD